MEKKPHLHDGHRERMRERFLATDSPTLQEHELLEMLLIVSIFHREMAISGARFFERKHIEEPVLDGIGADRNQLRILSRGFFR